MSFGGEEEERKAREALLNGYNSKSVAHGAYILSLAIAIFTVLQVLASTTLGEMRIPLGSFALSVLSVGVLQMMIRAFYWGSMTNVITYVIPTPDDAIGDVVEKLVKSGRAKLTMMWRLQDACAKEWGKVHPTVAFLARDWLKARTVLILTLITLVLWFHIWFLWNNLWLLESLF